MGIFKKKATWLLAMIVILSGAGILMLKGTFTALESVTGPIKIDSFAGGGIQPFSDGWLISDSGDQGDTNGESGVFLTYKLKKGTDIV